MVYGDDDFPRMPIVGLYHMPNIEKFSFYLKTKSFISGRDNLESLELGWFNNLQEVTVDVENNTDAEENEA